eukprot:5286177-Alexandrium_andersonii.AAC.1
MSASLVGSEMCIRDSLPNGPTAPPQNPQKAPPVRAGGAVFWGSPGTVSYTHLTLTTICSV